MKLIYLFIFIITFSFSSAQELSHEQKGLLFINYDYYSDGEEIEKQEYKELIKEDALAFERFNKHLRNKNWANVLSITSSVFTGINLANWITGGEFSWRLAGTQVVLFGLPTYFLNKKADKMLNNIEDNFNDQVGVEFIGNEYGAGIGFRF